MLNTSDFAIRLDNGFSYRHMAAKPVPATAAPPLAARPVTEPSQAEKDRPEGEEDPQEKNPILERMFAEDKKPPEPSPLDKVAEQAMNRMVSTRQALERFLLGAVTLAPEETEERAMARETQHLDTVA